MQLIEPASPKAHLLAKEQQLGEVLAEFSETSIHVWSTLGLFLSGGFFTFLAWLLLHHFLSPSIDTTFNSFFLLSKAPSTFILFLALLSVLLIILGLLCLLYSIKLLLNHENFYKLILIDKINK